MFFAHAHSSRGFQKTPKEQSWTTTTKKSPPETLHRQFYSTMESCIKSCDLGFVSSLIIINYSELFNRTWSCKKSSTISPGSSQTGLTYFLAYYPQSQRTVLQPLLTEMILVSSPIPACSPASSGYRYVWAERDRSQRSTGETSAAPAGGQDRRAWLRTTKRYGASCSRRRTGSVGDWSSSHQRWHPRLKRRETDWTQWSGVLCLMICVIHIHS